MDRFQFFKWVTGNLKFILNGFEKKYPNKKTQRKLIDACLIWINDPTNEMKRNLVDRLQAVNDTTLVKYYEFISLKDFRFRKTSYKNAIKILGENYL